MMNQCEKAMNCRNQGHRRSTARIESEIAKYCIQDVDLTYAIYSKLLPGLRNLNLI